MRKLTTLAALIIGLSAATVAAGSTARLQVIHNAADPSAAVVDVYVNGDLFLDDFAFRTATEFVEVPAGVTLNIGVAPGTSSSAADIIGGTIPVTLKKKGTYVAVANGVLDPALFSPNPDGRAIGFTLFAADGIRTDLRSNWIVGVKAFHGATDAPAVDIYERDHYRRPLFRDLAYGEFSGYRHLRPGEYVLDVTPAGQPGTVLVSYNADLSGLGGGTAIVFASGFLAPASSDQAAFGLFVALADGTVVPLPVAEQLAELQVIHNAADPAAEVVDVYVNDDLLLDNFAFRTATPFVSVPAGVELNIGVAPAGSSSSAEIIGDPIPVTLEAGQRYIAFANGVVQSGFAANPDGRSIDFTLFAVDNARNEARWGHLVDLIAFHGATDAPTVDVRVRNKLVSFTLFDDLTYGEFSDYLSVLPQKYTLDVTLADDKFATVASYKVDLSGLRGGAAVVFASGFLDPGSNLSGEGFGLFAALPDGTVLRLESTDIGYAWFSLKNGEEGALPSNFSLNQNYPNPFNPTTQISYAIPAAANVSLRVYNVLGQEVQTLVNSQQAAGQYTVEFDASALSSGVYFYRLEAGAFSDTRKMMLVR